MNNPETATLAIGSGSAALLAGQAGPQALLPEEVLTVPGAFALGMKAGNAKTNMEIEGGRAYLEMLNNGVSEETARAIATGVGGVNAALDTLQLDELLKAYKILNKAGADDTLLDILVREVTNRTIDTAVETGQEVLQEGVTIAGTQLGSKIDTGEWAYNLGEVGDRLWDTAKDSALTYGLMNVPSTVYNTHVQNQSHLAAEQQRSQLIAKDKQRILSGEMPTDAQLAAMKQDKAEVLGDLISYWLGGMDETELQKKVEQYSQVQYHEDGTVVVTDDWTTGGHRNVPIKYIPNAAIETLSHQGRQRDRTMYDATGSMELQIHSGDHGRPKFHTYGKNGEHAHDYVWYDDSIHPERTDRNILEHERTQHSDILGD